MNNNQLTFAREYRGITQTKLASMVDGLSQSNLSKFEKGMGVLSEDVLKRAMQELEFPYSFLDISMHHDYNKNFRKKAALKSSDKGKIERFVEAVAYCVDCMSDDLELPDFKFMCLDVETGITPEQVALQVRRQFRLGLAPIQNICNLLERNGVIVYEWDCEYDSFDGVSLTTTKGNRLIIINKNKSCDRKRNSLAHELGHTLMHNNIDFFIVDSRNIENEANRFASELLMPEEAIKTSVTNVKFSELPELKRYWLTSMSSIIVRAKRLNQIDDKKYEMLMRELSRNCWRINEPPFGVGIDSPVVVGKMYNAFKDGLGYSDSSLAEYMSLPSDVIQSVFGTNRKTISINIFTN